MKKLLYLLAAILLLSTVSCSDDDWGNDNAEYENVFYFGFQDWGKLKNDVTFSVSRGQTLSIPVQFWCRGTRSFDATAYYYIVSKLVSGTDYQVVDDQGTALTPDARGAYAMTWNLTATDTTDNHRVQNIHIQALRGATGDVTVQTFNPNDTAAISNTYTPNNITSQYEVHAFTQNYKVKVTIK